MKKLWDKLNNVLPIVWGTLIVSIITFGLLSLAIWMVNSLLTLMGVIV